MEYEESCKLTVDERRSDEMIACCNETTEQPVDSTGSQRYRKIQIVQNLSNFQIRVVVRYCYKDTHGTSETREGISRRKNITNSNIKNISFYLHFILSVII